jgi:hypothetical protein
VYMLVNQHDNEMTSEISAKDEMKRAISWAMTHLPLKFHKTSSFSILRFVPPCLDCGDGDGDALT